MMFRWHSFARRTALALSSGASLALLFSPVAAGEPAAPGFVRPAVNQEIRGLLRPMREATLSSDILGKIVDLPFEEGMAFRKGDVLVRFDCARYKAELAAARAEHAARKKTYDNNKELATYNAVATLQVGVSRDELAKAQAGVEAASALVGGCTIQAPWNGRVVENLAHRYETVQPGKELLRILDDSELEVTVIVPSKWLRWLKAGTPFRFSVDETGKSYQARVKWIGSRVDPVSQTVRLTGRLDNVHRELLAGMSGAAHFDEPKE